MIVNNHISHFLAFDFFQNAWSHLLDYNMCLHFLANNQQTDQPNNQTSKPTNQPNKQAWQTSQPKTSYANIIYNLAIESKYPYCCVPGPLKTGDQRSFRDIHRSLRSIPVDVTMRMAGPQADACSKRSPSPMCLGEKTGWHLKEPPVWVLGYFWIHFWEKLCIEKSDMVIASMKKGWGIKEYQRMLNRICPFLRLLGSRLWWPVAIDMHLCVSYQQGQRDF